MTTDSPGQIAELRREIELWRERETLLTQIEEVTRGATDPAEITYEIARLLGSPLRVNRCAYAEVEPDQNNLTVIGDFVDGLPSMAGSYTLQQFSSSAYDLLTSGQPFIVEDSERVGEEAVRTHLHDQGKTGTGLGLWVNKEIIDRHGGAVRLRSSQSKLHPGSVFTIFLPFDAVVC